MLYVKIILVSELLHLNIESSSNLGGTMRSNNIVRKHLISPPRRTEGENQISAGHSRLWRPTTKRATHTLYSIFKCGIRVMLS